MTGPTGYWPSRWPGEDGGPGRTQAPAGGPGLGVQPGERLVATSRDVPVATMVVLRDPGEAYLLRHTGGDDAISWVERFDPESLEPIERSPDLPGGPTWPGGVAVHANGALYVVFGRHAHRLAPDTTVEVTRELPRARPYNSFLILPDGHLVTKDFGGRLPGGAAPSPEPTELLVLEPERLEVVARLELAEPSVARLSADGSDVYVVGTERLLRVGWDGTRLVADDAFTPRYRTREGQGYGWDAVVDGGAAWLLDNGDGSERYAGTFVGQGVCTAPLQLLRVDLATGAVDGAEICGLPGGVVANPPAVDVARGVAVGYDSGNGVVAGFSIPASRGAPLERRWTREQAHACHPLRYPDTGELVTGDHDAATMAESVVVLDVSTGEERARVTTGGPLQSVVFPSPGFGRDLYWCSFSTLTRITVE